LGLFRTLRAIFINLNPRLKQYQHPRLLAVVITIPLLGITALLAYLIRHQCTETCAMTPLQDIKADQECTPRVLTQSLTSEVLGFKLGNPDIDSDGISGPTMQSINGSFGARSAEVGFDCDILFDEPNVPDGDFDEKWECNGCSCLSDSATDQQDNNNNRAAFDNCVKFGGMQRHRFYPTDHNIDFEYNYNRTKNNALYTVRMRTHAASYASYATGLKEWNPFDNDDVPIEDANPNTIVGHYGFSKAASTSCCKHPIHEGVVDSEQFSCINSEVHSGWRNGIYSEDYGLITDGSHPYAQEPQYSLAVMQSTLYDDVTRWQRVKEEFMLSQTLNCCSEVCPSWISAIGSAFGYLTYLEIGITLPVLVAYMIYMNKGRLSQADFSTMLAVAQELPEKGEGVSVPQAKYVSSTGLEKSAV